MLTAGRLRSVLRYDRKTGIFTWRVRKSQKRPGDVAGSFSKALGYIEIRIDGKLYYAHRLAWLYVKGAWPRREVDHRDTRTTNNCWRNLRAATKAQNGRNRGLNRNNTSGHKGVIRTPSGRWCARIRKDWKQFYLGTFDTAEAAAIAYANAARRKHRNFARTR